MVGGAFAAAVPDVIGVVAVAVLLAVRLVVLVVVTDEIVEGEPVMGGDEVDAGPGPAPLVAEDVGGAGEARGEIGRDALVAFPQAPHRVAVLRVPLGPAGRELAELIAVGPDIPRLGHGLPPRRHRGLPARAEEP